MSGKLTDSIQGSDGENGIVAELYALRAGLSVVSQCRDDILEVANDIGRIKDTVKAIQAEITENDVHIAKTKTQLSNRQKNIEDKEKNKDKLIKDRVKKKYDQRYEEYAEIMMGIWGAFVPFLGILLFGILSIVGFVKEWQATSLFLYLALICIVIFSIFIIIFLFRGRVRKKFVREFTTELDNEIEQDKHEQIEISKTLAELEVKAEELQKEKEEISAKADADIEEISSERLAPTLYEASICRSTLESKYKKLLNPTDWQNVDLCIFYLQTGRADTIRECLLLADRQRQNDEIVGAIRQASESIGAEIRSGFAALGKTMVTCINALSAQMEVAFNQLADQQRQNTEALQSMQALGEDMLSAQQLNNALAAKALGTSEQLMRDYKFVQNFNGIPV